MKVTYLGLVIARQSTNPESNLDDKYIHLHTITDAQIVNGLLEIVETNGDIIRCNSSETKEVLENSVPFIKRALLGENPIPGSNIQPLFDEYE